MSKYIIDIPEGREYFPEFLPTDDFYSGIYISTEHMKSFCEDFPTTRAACISLIEEMSELTKAICKWERNKGFKKDLEEEIAHVLISLKGVVNYFGIDSEDIEVEIGLKCPEAYYKEKTDE